GGRRSVERLERREDPGAVCSARCERFGTRSPAVHTRNLRQAWRFEAKLGLALQVHGNMALRAHGNLLLGALGRADEVDAVVPDAFLHAVRLVDDFGFLDLGQECRSW